MNIRHERPLPDLSFAVAAPLLIQTADDTILSVKRWSLEGVWVDPAGYDITQVATLAVPFQGVDVSFDVQLASTDDPEYFLFRSLTVRQRETLSAFYQGVLSGRMVPVNDMITSLDTPVDLVPTGETKAEKKDSAAKAKPRALRVVGHVAFYMFAALFLSVFIGGHIWERLSRIPLDHGRFVAPIQQYDAPDTGYIERLYVRVGETVAQGDILARLEDPDRESDVEEVRGEVLIAQRRLQAAQDRVAAHAADKHRFRAPFLAALGESWHHQRDHHPGTGVLTTAARQAHQDLMWFDSGMDVQNGGFHTILTNLETQAEEKRLDLRRWKRELRHRKAAADEYLVRAKLDGTVFSVPVRMGDYVGRRDMVVEVEDDTPRTVVGWLDDNMVTSVYIGQTANVQFGFRGEAREMEATVIDLQAGTDTVQPDKFGMIVTLKVSDAGLKTSRKLFRRNAPVRIELKRDLFANRWKGRDDESS